MSLENTLRTYQGRLEEIQLHSSFIAQSTAIPHMITPYLGSDQLRAAPHINASFDRHRASVANVRQDDIRAALLVQAFAATEWFIGAILLRVASYFDKVTKRYSELPPPVARTHIRLVGKALALSDQAKSHERLNVEQLCVRLAGCHADSESFQLSEDVFRLYLPNMDSKALGESLKRIGFEIDWDACCDEPEIKRFLSIRSKRKAAKKARQIFDEMAERRNVIAHRGDGSVGVSEDELAQTLEFLHLFSRNLVDQITAYLRSRS